MAKPFAALAFIFAALVPPLCVGTSALAQPVAEAADIPVSSANARRALGRALEAGDREAATASAWLLANMGGSLSAASRARVAPVLNAGATALSPALDARFDANATPIERSRAILSVPLHFRLIEGIAFDPVHRRLFAGSVADRALLTHGAQGWAALPIANLGGVFGMAVDNERRLLWLATGHADPVPGGADVFAGLVAVDLDRLTEARRVAMPGVRPGDVAIGRDGSLFVSDGTTGAIHICRPGCTTLSVLVAPGRLPSPQGMVAHADGRRLIVADYSRGLLSVDIATGVVEPIFPAEPAMLEGIDGLLAHNDRLIAIQNGSSPRRIIAISLDADARAITAIEVLERAHRGWGEPTLGVIDGDRLIYVADAQWERFGPGGTQQGDGPLRPTAIRALTIP